MRPDNRGVLILPAPLQILLGATVFAVTVPGVADIIMGPRWPITAYLLFGAGVFVAYLAAFVLGWIKPYARSGAGNSSALAPVAPPVKVHGESQH